MGKRYRAAGPWPDGAFYVWDTNKSSICDPRGPGLSSKWPNLISMDEAQAAADALNIRENNAALDALCLTALRARDNEDLLT
jgi:hypothetical protein